MKWFLIQMVFQVRIGGGAHPAEFEEQLRLINAASGGEALEKARCIGMNEEGLVVDVPGGPGISWEFIGIAMLSELDRLPDGAHLNSSTRRPRDPEAYIRITRTRALHIQNSDTLVLPQNS